MSVNRLDEYFDKFTDDLYDQIPQLEENQG